MRVTVECFEKTLPHKADDRNPGAIRHSTIADRTMLPEEHKRMLLRRGGAPAPGPASAAAGSAGAGKAAAKLAAEPPWFVGKGDTGKSEHFRAFS